MDAELEIADFGPIAGGKIALRPLTILVGPNNSGKSYASTLAHSVISALADLAGAARSGDWAAALAGDVELRGLSARAARLAASANGGGEVAVPRGLADAIHRRTAGRLFEGSLVSHMAHNFGSPLGSLVRTGSRSSRIRIRGPISADVSISRRRGASVRTGNGGKQCSIRGPPVAVAGAATDATRSGVAGNGRGGTGLPSGGPAGGRAHTALLWLAVEIAGQAVAGRAGGASHYLPAARSGVVCAHGALAPGILQDCGNGAQGGMGVAGTVSDMADSLALARKSRHGGGGGSLVAGVLGGRLEARAPGAQSLYYTRGATSVPLHMSSSGVHGAAPLALAAAGAAAGDTIVVEEPEVNLHPQSQVRLAGRLVGLVRRGVRVILSTHSPFLLDQLGIFLQLASLTPAKRKRRGYGEGDYVSAGEVAPYAFGGSASRGYVVSEIAHSEDEGISRDEFTRVTAPMAEDEYGIYVAQGGE